MTVVQIFKSHLEAQQQQEGLLPEAAEGGDGGGAPHVSFFELVKGLKRCVHCLPACLPARTVTADAEGCTSLP
jgi:hypothetical protein